MRGAAAFLFVTIGVLVACSRCAASQAPPPQGKLIDVGGRKLHLVCQGSGTPAVILESGAGEFSFDWTLVMPEIAEVTRVCAWDRAGYAWSDMSAGFERFPDVASDMHELLRRAGIVSPLILVGHALGALYARDYQRRYPGEIAALILVDPMPEEDVQVIMFGRTVSLIDMADHDLASWPVRPYAPSRTSPPPQRPSSATDVEAPFDKLPASLHATRRWALDRLFGELDGLSSQQALEVMESERAAFAELYNARHASKLAIPVAVLSRGRDTSEQIVTMQNELAGISTNSAHRVVEASGEQIEIEQPKAVASAVTEMVKALRSGSR